MSFILLERRGAGRFSRSFRLGLFLGGLALSGLFVSACKGRPQNLSKKSQGSSSESAVVAIVNLTRGAPEDPGGGGLFAAPTNQTFVSLIRSLVRIEKDEHVASVFVKLRSQPYSFSQSREIGEHLARIKKVKGAVVCHTHDVSNSTFWLLSRGCTDIWLSAAGSVGTVGIGAELSYLKGAFDKFGIQADMMAMGKYKSGGEALTRTGPTEASLGNLQNTLFELRSQWLQGISEGHKEGEVRKKLAEDGPYSPQRALELGLVDHVGFEDEAFSSAKKAGKTENIESFFGGAPSSKESPAAEMIRMLAGAKKGKRISVVPAVGSITMAAGGPLGGGAGITAAAMTRTLRRLRKDTDVLAVVMRMDSPGGSPLASDLIWREMMLMRKVKPIVVSIGGMSASGGYYIASGASKIVASPTAIVGSIGVFGGKIVLGGALKKLGVTHYQVAASPEVGAAARATHLSPLSPWDEATRERVRQSMRRIYDLFVERVAEGRAMDTKRVYATAEGEIFLATEGKKRGLIDDLGGIEKSLAWARKLADLPDDISIVVEGGAETLLESLFLGPEPEAREVEAALVRFEQKRAEAIAHWALGDALGQLLPFQAATAPLFAGESVVAALPYSLKLH